MGAESDHFRLRAKHCRELAKAARNETSRQTLDGMAEELEEEADRIDAEE